MIAADQGKQYAAGITSTIVILPLAIDEAPNAQQLGLSESEDALLNLLIVISQRVGSPVFDLNQMKATCQNWQDGYIELGKFTGACSMEYQRLGATRSVGWQWILPAYWPSCWDWFAAGQQLYRIPGGWSYRAADIPGRPVLLDGRRDDRAHRPRPGYCRPDSGP